MAQLNVKDDDKHFSAPTSSSTFTYPGAVPSTRTVTVTAKHTPGVQLLNRDLTFSIASLKQGETVLGEDFFDAKPSNPFVIRIGETDKVSLGFPAADRTVSARAAGSISISLTLAGGFADVGRTVRVPFKVKFNSGPKKGQYVPGVVGAFRFPRGEIGTATTTVDLSAHAPASGTASFIVELDTKNVVVETGANPGDVHNFVNFGDNPELTITLSTGISAATTFAFAEPAPVVAEVTKGYHGTEAGTTTAKLKLTATPAPTTDTVLGLTTFSTVDGLLTGGAKGGNSNFAAVSGTGITADYEVDSAPLTITFPANQTEAEVDLPIRAIRLNSGSANDRFASRYVGLTLTKAAATPANAALSGPLDGLLLIHPGPGAGAGKAQQVTFGGSFVWGEGSQAKTSIGVASRDRATYRFAVNEGTAELNDISGLTLSSGRYFNITANGRGDLPLRAKADTVYEGNETFTIELVNAGGPPLLLPNPRKQTITITEASPKPKLAIILPEGVVQPTIVENLGATNIGFTIGAVASKFPYSVDWRLASATATEGTDFTAASGTLSIPAGSKKGSISISAIDDELIEGEELFYLFLDPSTSDDGITSAHLAFDQRRYIVSLTDDDELPTSAPSGAPTLSLEAPTAALALGLEWRLTARLSKAAAYPVATTWALSGRLPANRRELVDSTHGKPNELKLTFAPGETEKNIVVRTLDHSEGFGRPGGTLIFKLAGMKSVGDTVHPGAPLVTADASAETGKTVTINALGSSGVRFINIESKGATAFLGVALGSVGGDKSLRIRSPEARCLTPSLGFTGFTAQLLGLTGDCRYDASIVVVGPPERTILDYGTVWFRTLPETSTSSSGDLTLSAVSQEIGDGQKEVIVDLTAPLARFATPMRAALGNDGFDVGVFLEGVDAITGRTITVANPRVRFADGQTNGKARLKIARSGDLTADATFTVRAEVQGAGDRAAFTGGANVAVQITLLATPTLRIKETGPVDVNEGDTGDTPPQIPFTLQLVTGDGSLTRAGAPVNIAWKTTELPSAVGDISPATGDTDYVAVDETVIIPPGASEIPLKVVVTPDNTQEGTEQFYAEFRADGPLTNAEEADSGDYSARLLLQINDDDAAPPVAYFASACDTEALAGCTAKNTANYNFQEGKTARVTIALSKPAQQPATLVWSVKTSGDGMVTTATQGDDYRLPESLSESQRTAQSGEVSFLVGEGVGAKAKTFDIFIRPDSASDNNEKLVISLAKKTSEDPVLLPSDTEAGSDYDGRAELALTLKQAAPVKPFVSIIPVDGDGDEIDGAVEFTEGAAQSFIVRLTDATGTKATALYPDDTQVTVTATSNDPDDASKNIIPKNFKLKAGANEGPSLTLAFAPGESEKTIQLVVDADPSADDKAAVVTLSAPTAASAQLPASDNEALSASFTIAVKNLVLVAPVLSVSDIQPKSITLSADFKDYRNQAKLNQVGRGELYVGDFTTANANVIVRAASEGSADEKEPKCTDSGTTCVSIIFGSAIPFGAPPNVDLNAWVRISSKKPGSDLSVLSEPLLITNRPVAPIVVNVSDLVSKPLRRAKGGGPIPATNRNLTKVADGVKVIINSQNLPAPYLIYFIERDINAPNEQSSLIEKLPPLNRPVKVVNAALVKADETDSRFVDWSRDGDGEIDQAATLTACNAQEGLICKIANSAGAQTFTGLGDFESYRMRARGPTGKLDEARTADFTTKAGTPDLTTAWNNDGTSLTVTISEVNNLGFYLLALQDLSRRAQQDGVNPKKDSEGNVIWDDLSGEAALRSNRVIGSRISYESTCDSDLYIGNNRYDLDCIQINDGGKTYAEGTFMLDSDLTFVGETGLTHTFTGLRPGKPYYIFFKHESDNKLNHDFVVPNWTR